MIKIRATFIRAPVVTDVKDPTIKVIAKLDDNEIVALRQGHILGTSFHPELTRDSRWHKYFVDMVDEHCKIKQ